MAFPSLLLLAASCVIFLQVLPLATLATPHQYVKNRVDPSKCLNVYEGKYGVTMGEMGADTDINIAQGTVHVDLVKYKRVVTVDEIHAFNSTITMRLVEDMRTNMVYLIIPAQRACMKLPLPAPLQQETCPCNKLKYVGSETVGIGPDAIDVNVYEQRTNNSATISLGKFYATKEECAPVFYNFIYKGIGIEQVQGQIFSNLRRGVKDLSVFEVPDYCDSWGAFVRNEIMKKALFAHKARRISWGGQS